MGRPCGFSREGSCCSANVQVSSSRIMLRCTSCPYDGIGSDQRRSQRRPFDSGSTNLLIYKIPVWLVSIDLGVSQKRDARALQDNPRTKSKCLIRGLHTFSRSERYWSSGEIPPCTQKNRPSRTAAIGSAWKERTHASYIVAEYLCKPFAS